VEYTRIKIVIKVFGGGKLINEALKALLHCFVFAFQRFKTEQRNKWRVFKGMF